MVLTWPKFNRCVFGSRFYHWILSGRIPEHIQTIPPHPWPGNPSAAEPFLDSPSLLPGITKYLDDVPWHGFADTDPKARMYHRFAWLTDLQAVGTEAARKRAQALLKSWIADQGSWQPLSWQPEILGERLSHWLQHQSFLTQNFSDEEILKFSDSIARQLRHLKRVIGTSTQDERSFLPLKGMIYGSICLSGFDALLKDGLSRLEKAIEKQILPDGGHISRNPSLMLQLLRHFIDIRAALINSQTEVPVSLQRAIDRMGPILRCLRHGDGGLALFNGGTAETNDEINQTFLQSGTKTKAISNAPHTGYQRLAAKRTVIIVDAGNPPAPPFDRHAHAAPLSFEMSIGKERLIVNCGSFTGNDPAWHNALRATAAHSGVTINDVNAVEISPKGGLTSKNVKVEYERQESDGNIWFEASHNGYGPRLKINHKRRLYLSADGNDIRGDDELTGGTVGSFAIRFHFHPDVRASLVQDGSAVLVRLKNGEGWRLRVNGGALSLDDSIYLSDGRNAKRSQQAVILGNLGPDGALVKWRLDRVNN
ncbi:MAG: heparinase II/III family protein [Rhodospirillales bacterium]